MRESHDRIKSVEIALNRAVVRLKRQKRQHDARRNAEAAFNARQKGAVLLPEFPPLDYSVFRHDEFRELDEGFLEDALAAVSPDDLGILPHVGKKSIQRLTRMAFRQCFALEPFDKSAEIAAAWHVGRRRTEL